MLILPEETAKKIQVRVRISENIMQEIKEYCDWSGIKTKDYFIEQACKHIFAHDEEWKEHKSRKKAIHSKTTK